MVQSISVGWLIFYKSLVQLFSHFFKAIWFSGIAILLLVLINILTILGIEWVLKRTGPLPDGIPELVAVFIPLSILAIFLLWHLIGYKWMRFMLAKEREQNLSEMQPSFWSYLKFAILSILTIAVVIGIPTVLALFVATLSMSSINFVVPWSPYATAILSLLASFFYLRLSLVLPAVAIGSWMTFGDSFAETSKYSGAIFIVVLLEYGLIRGTTYLTDLISGNLNLYLVLFTASSWFFAMLSICIITTLFAYIVNSATEPVSEPEIAD